MFIEEVSKEVEVGDHIAAVKAGLASAMAINFRLAKLSMLFTHECDSSCFLCHKCNFVTKWQNDYDSDLYTDYRNKASSLRGLV